MLLCNVNFESKYARIDGKTVSIDEYLRNPLGTDIKCLPHGHQLTSVNCTTKRSHFRHKNSNDTGGSPMTKWHAEWQSNFIHTEKDFNNNSNQLRARRADIVVPEFKRIIEIQHSKISSGEVNERMKDYKVHNHTVEWVLDAQNSIQIKKLGDRNVLYFTSNMWLFESFLSCTTVYYDINEFIYKVNPTLVRSCQIEVCDPKPKGEFILDISNNAEIWKTDEIPQAHIYVKQKGAGSGKTYGMMQLLNSDPEISTFKFIIFITKQHSAVNVMFTEFMEQYADKKLPNIILYEEPIVNEGEVDYSPYMFRKQYIVTYTHSITKVITVAIFGTVDSFTYAVGESQSDVHDTFVGIVKSMIDGYSKVKRSGRMDYASVNPYINKEAIIMIDETQDLSELYGEAFLKFVSSTNTNLCVVGDRLQSLKNEENALTYLHRAEMALMRVVRETASNEVRRFSDPQLLNFVNTLIPFEKYGLPKMTAHKVIERQPNALTIFSGNTVYANEEPDSDDIIKSVAEIMYYFKREVNENKCVPEDFLVVTPFTKTNPLVEALQLAISEFWKDTMETNLMYIEEVKSKHDHWKNVNTNTYTRYAVFHRAQEMGSINLNDSEYATRMVSIHSSKGDGRKVVFVIGVTESSLRLFSQVSKNIIYYSFLHVATTRQKERLYFRLERNGDDIHRRIEESFHCEKAPSIEFNYTKALTFSSISDKVLNIKWNSLHENIICKTKIPALPNESGEKLLIDMGDHNIRFASMLINIMIHSHNYEQRTRPETKKQFSAIFYNVKNAPIRKVSNTKEYLKALIDNEDSYKVTRIPILHFITQKTDIDYERYYTIIYDTMERIQHELSNVGKGQLDYFCPLESVVLYYMIECIESSKYQKVTINDLYNIIDIYSKVFDSSAKGHEYCRCKVHFTNPRQNLNDYQKKCHEYLLNHYNRISHINTILDRFTETHTNVNWLYDHPIYFNNTPEEKSYSICRRYTLIGYDNDSVYIFNIKPQLNDLNLNESKVNGICDTWLLSKTLDPKFKNKRILSCVLSLNRTEIHIIDWNDIIREQSDYLTKMICDTVKEDFKIKHNSYYTTFLNVIEEKREAAAICSYVNSSCIIGGLPIHTTYLIEFWKYFTNDIDREDTIDEKMDKLSEYKKETYFIKELDRCMNRSLDKFFGIKK